MKTWPNAWRISRDGYRMKEKKGSKWNETRYQHHFVGIGTGFYCTSRFIRGIKEFLYCFYHCEMQFNDLKHHLLQVIQFSRRKSCWAVTTTQWWQGLPGKRPRAQWCSGQRLTKTLSRRSSSLENKWAHTLGTAWLSPTSTMTSASLNTTLKIDTICSPFLPPYSTFGIQEPSQRTWLGDWLPGVKKIRCKCIMCLFCNPETQEIVYFSLCP